MALNLRARFGPLTAEPRPVLADDFVFSPSDYPSLREMRIEHDELTLLEAPLAVDRRYFLSHGSDSLQIEFALCLHGFGAAVDLLFGRLASFQREPSESAVVDMARTLGVGHVGFSWGWGPEERDGVVAFVRHNLLVMLLGRHDTLLQQARELDAALMRHPTAAASVPRAETMFAAAPTLAVKAGERVELGAPAAPEDRYFFVATGGSVNLDADKPEHRYYRAGLTPGAYLIYAFRVGRGLLPTQQTLRVDVSGASRS
jgi:hypothetical protein